MMFSTMAAAEWAGFTDEDIKEIKSKTEPQDPSIVKDAELPMRPHKPMRIKGISRKIKEEEILEPSEDKTTALNDAREEFSRHKARATRNNLLGTQSHLNAENSVENNNNPALANSETIFQAEDHLEHEDNPEMAICNEIAKTEDDMPPLEAFELRQKRIEAENARRRALITKAIMDKKKRTQAEVMKLAKISEELNRLDSNLSADVAILRDCIETASIEFSEAEKRYLKAEKEFVQAKLVLFEKMQRKEQLTEHLCAIIEQNENRKANKLVELMKKLEMEEIMEEYQENGLQPILSSLCMMDDEAYHHCQTLSMHLQDRNNPQDIQEPLSVTTSIQVDNTGYYNNGDDAHLSTEASESEKTDVHDVKVEQQSQLQSENSDV